MPDRSLESRITYFTKLVGAGFDGVVSARPANPPHWTPAAIGAAAGAIGVGMLGNRRSRSSAVLTGVVGTLVGVGAALAWTSRTSIGPAIRRAQRQVNTVRDAHWLASHPITYA